MNKEDITNMDNDYIGMAQDCRRMRKENRFWSNDNNIFLPYNEEVEDLIKNLSQFEDYCLDQSEEVHYEDIQV